MSLGVSESPVLDSYKSQDQGPRGKATEPLMSRKVLSGQVKRAIGSSQGRRPQGNVSANGSTNGSTQVRASRAGPVRAAPRVSSVRSSAAQASPRRQVSGKHVSFATNGETGIQNEESRQLVKLPWKKKILPRVETVNRGPKEFRKEMIKDNRIKKAVFNGQDIFQINVDEYFQYEYLYFRDMEIQQLDFLSIFPNLRVLDLSNNRISNLEFLQNMPALRHLTLTSNALTSLETLPPNLEELESLALGNNKITTFQGMPAFDNLRMLSINSNQVEDLNGLPILLSLDTFDSRENPLVERVGDKQLKDMIVGLHKFSPLKRVNGQVIEPKNPLAFKTFGGKVAYCVREGYLPPVLLPDVDEEQLDQESHSIESIRKQAASHLIQNQILKTENSSIQLYHIGLTEYPKEGVASELSAIFKLRQPDLSFDTEEFAKHTFESFDEYLVINGVAVPLDKQINGKYSATLLLTLGKYTFGFTSKPDGVPTEEETIELSEPTLPTRPSLGKSTLSQSFETNKFDQEFVIFVQWFQLGEDDLFQEIDGANSPILHPNVEHVNRSLKAQIFVFDQNTEMLFSVFGISEAVEEGLPTVQSLEIVGECVEGGVLRASVEYFGGYEGDSVCSWTGADGRVVEGFEFEPTLADVEGQISLSYTPIRKDGLVGEMQTIQSSIIQPAIPTITDIHIEGVVAEGCSFNVVYDYYGGHQGNCAIQWLRENLQTGDFEPIEGATSPSFEASLEDVHCQLQVRVTPISDKGVAGEDVYFSMAPTLAAPPVIVSLGVSSLKLEEDKILVLEPEYYGGTEGRSTVEWYRVSDDESRELIAHATDIQMYKCTFEDVGKFIEAIYTPRRDDGVLGEPVVIRTERVIRSGPPKCTSLHIDGEPLEGSNIRLVYGYKGGVEGNSTIRWYRVPASAVQEKEEVHQAPEATEDVAAQESEEVPLEQVDEAIEDTPLPGSSQELTASLDADVASLALEEASRELKAIPADQKELVGLGDQYQITLEDTEHRIMVEYIPVREDGYEGEVVCAYTPIIQPEDPRLSNVNIIGELKEGEMIRGVATYYGGYEGGRRHQWIRIRYEEDSEQWLRSVIEDATDEKYVITTDDVACHLIYAAQPLSKYDVEGSWVESETSEAVLPKQPEISSLTVKGDHREGEILEASAQGENVDLASSLIRWYRIESDGSEILLVSNTWTYEPTLEDVGSVLSCRLTPVRADLNLPGSEATYETQPIVYGIPSIVQFHVKGQPMEGTNLEVSFTYKGGLEGATRIQWFRVTATSSLELKGFANCLVYPLVAEDIDHKVKCIVTPVREDGIEGDSQSQVSSLIRAAGPIASDLKLEGSPSENSSLTVSYTYFGGVEGRSQIRWYRILSDTQEKVAISVDTTTYAIVLDDLEHVIQCEVVPVRDDGERGPPSVVLSEVIQPNHPVITDVQLVGTAEVSEQIDVSGTYTGGFEGESIFEFETSATRNGPWTLVSQTPFAIPTNLLNQFIRVRYTPVRKDGVQGSPVESAPMCVRLSRAQYESIVSSINEMQASLEVNPSILILKGQLSLTETEDNKKKTSKLPLNQISVTYGEDPNTLFVSRPVKTDVETFTITASSRQERDICVLTIQTFIGLSNNALTESILGKPFLTAWGKRKNLPAALDAAQSQVSMVEKPTEAELIPLYEILRTIHSQNM